MPRKKLEFPGTDGLTIAGLLELPEKNPQAFALFAHCFTCGKDVVPGESLIHSKNQRLNHIPTHSPTCRQSATHTQKIGVFGVYSGFLSEKPRPRNHCRA